jgi:hypothetical protein
MKSMKVNCIQKNTKDRECQLQSEYTSKKSVQNSEPKLSDRNSTANRLQQQNDRSLVQQKLGFRQETKMQNRQKPQCFSEHQLI